MISRDEFIARAADSLLRKAGHDPASANLLATGAAVTLAESALAAVGAWESLFTLYQLRDLWFEPHYGQNDIGMAALLRDTIRHSIAKAEGCQ